MEKVKMGSVPFVFPMPAAIVGADVEGAPTFMTIAYCGVVNNGPAMVAIGSNPGHYTMRGIEEHGSFSINIPSENLVARTDYVGMHSGATTDKSGVFDVFYGECDHAPLIRECPVNLACRVTKRLDIGGKDAIVIGEVVQCYVSGDALTDGAPDIEKMRPILYATGSRTYWGIGEKVGDAWNIGATYEP